MTTRNIPFRSIVLGAALTCIGGAAALAAPNPITYLNGTYLFVSLDSLQCARVTISFDGAGNFSTTETDNAGGTITTQPPGSGTYTVASNGTFALAATNLTGELSADGNVIILIQVAPNSTPNIAIGIKQGLVSTFNVASGLVALASNTTGANNTAVGYAALYSNTVGKGNAAQGVNALFSNTTGIRNLGIGSNALYGNTIGGYNIALGFDAGYNVTTGSNNIEIGAMGAAGDNGTIQIGVQGTQTLTTIAGIYGTPLTGSAVYVTSTGQLGVQASSERYKTDIATMPNLSEKLAQLRPVTFHYRTDPKSVQQYGLIAEEVAKVYPELVIRDDSGKIQGVHYEELAPMLLGEMQQQRGELQEQQATIQSQSAKINDLTQRVAELKDLKQEMRAALHRLEAKEELLAQR
jgi:hypothetical protein